jgi:Spy/CpxP family protein refolding chaperone
MSTQLDLHTKRTSSLSDDVGYNASTSPAPAATAARKSVEEHDTNNDDDRIRRLQDTTTTTTTTRGKMNNIATRLTRAMKKRENRKLAACYWALGAAGW